ncbi:hypothetical protein GCM10010495_74500 [Kitasatospora herbaricolor]|uniref:hypothetical protein n=1 Tax=Kitasatospora herbaricolor TaxID=68217 RepID=UPI00174BF0E2|nr:hypothetical protein [Kitasatospora herbaricolor]MDQ0306464.1 pyruvate/2-oxoglutarate dehydrogenase complex dihydrolipoamide acyltransferase (E2) component [Kitasatospora herbaricolor]GGV46030.1 hypothetical protein GCM10010495_74500 [Kitasatospora herbaricolor]
MDHLRYDGQPGGQYAPQHGQEQDQLPEHGREGTRGRPAAAEPARVRRRRLVALPTSGMLVVMAAVLVMCGPGAQGGEDGPARLSGPSAGPAGPSPEPLPPPPWGALPTPAPAPAPAPVAEPAAAPAPQDAATADGAAGGPEPAPPAADSPAAGTDGTEGAGGAGGAAGRGPAPQRPARPKASRGPAAQQGPAPAPGPAAPPAAKSLCAKAEELGQWPAGSAQAAMCRGMYGG